MKLAAALFAAASFAGCSLLKVAVATGDPLSKEQMNVRTMTRGFYYDMAGEVARAADSIVAASPDVNVRVAAVRWKIRATRAGVTAAMQGIPDVALVDSVPPHERGFRPGARFAAVRSSERHRPRRRPAARPPGRKARPAGASGRPLCADGAVRYGLRARQPRLRGRRDRQHDPRVAGIPPGGRRRTGLRHRLDRRGAGRRQRPAERPDPAGDQQCELVEGHLRDAAPAGQPAPAGRGAAGLARTQFQPYRGRRRAPARDFGQGAGGAEPAGHAAHLDDERFGGQRFRRLRPPARRVAAIRYA